MYMALANLGLRPRESGDDFTLTFDKSPLRCTMPANKGGINLGDPAAKYYIDCNIGFRGSRRGRHQNMQIMFKKADYSNIKESAEQCLDFIVNYLKEHGVDMQPQTANLPSSPYFENIRNYTGQLEGKDIRLGLTRQSGGYYMISLGRDL